MNKMFLLLAFGVLLYVLAGCIMPKYQFCCFADSAFPEDPSNAVCTGLIEEGAEETIEVLSCDEETWTFITGLDPESGEPIEVPVCPNIEVSPCTSNCSGLFCGNFFYDPRPPYGMTPGDESHAHSREAGEGNTAAVTNEPIGLWKAECRMRALDPLFLRNVENSDDVVMGTFRFGVGSSFQDFEMAQYYFPITDQACYLNPGGSVDRYIVYAVPNRLGYGTLCDKSENIYTCTDDSNIQSYNYFDCASRCALGYYGYEPKIEPFNPYLTYYENKIVGNPFTYGPLSYHYDPIDNDQFIFPQARPKVASYSGILPLDDNYLTGTTLYGSVFGEPILTLDPDGKGEYCFFELMAEKGSDPDATKQVPSFSRTIPGGDEDTYSYADMHFYLDWNDEGDHKAQTTFLTVEQDPHNIYPWLLAHHSVYNPQFKLGHRLVDGTSKTGAEFECLGGQDCLSGYCNSFDYARSACVGGDGEDILCDCWSETGKTMCMGSAAAKIGSWDDSGVDIEVPIVLAAAVDYTGSGSGYSIASLPAIGSVRTVEFLYLDGDNKGEPIGDLEGKIPLFIMHIGGPGTEWTASDGYKRVSPDYLKRSFEEIFDSGSSGYKVWGRARRLISPCTIFPKSWTTTNWYSIGYSGTTYVTCCGSTSDCSYDGDGDYDGADDVYVRSAINEGEHATRFVENCMEGYKKYVHACYEHEAADAKMLDIPGWDYSGGEVNQELEDHWWEGGKGDGGLCNYIYHMSTDDANQLTGYQWSGGSFFPMGTGDEDKAESVTFIAIEPRWDEDLDRWAFGNCLLNEQGNDLELHEYGICESCGYLTMAKQEITALDEHDWDDPDLTEIYDGELQANRRTGNMYCPDMVIKTPLSFFDLITLDSESAIYALSPFMMNGYVQVDYGSSQWGSEVDFDKCIYPNGRVVVHNEDTYDMTTYRGLPNVLPDAYYLTSKLESMMKRNIQPVLFATDKDLWDSKVDIQSPSGNKEIEDAYRVAIQLDSGGDPQWATANFLFDLLERRSDVFILAEECDNEDEGEECTYYAKGGAFLTNVVMDGGAVVIVPLTYPVYGGGSSFMGMFIFGDEDEELDPDKIFQSEYLDRGRTTRFLCPNCMIALAIGYPPTYVGGMIEGEDLDALLAETDPGAFDVELRLEQIDAALSNPEVAAYVDVLALNFEMEYDDDYCDIDNQQERFDAILANLTYLGRETLKRHGKPIIITDLIIKRSSTGCWTSESSGDFMAYLGAHNEELVSSGYLGLMYGKWDSNNLEGKTGIRHSVDNAYKRRDEFYAGVFTGARNFAGQTFQVFYTEVAATPECPCIPCTLGDPSYLCNGRFRGTGPRCEGYESGTPVKWPDNCITTDVCTILHFPSIGPDAVASCDLLYNNGTIDQIDFPLGDVMDNPTAYRDVIASLDLELPLCFVTGSERLLTYFRSEEVGYMPTPILFDKTGDQETICDPMQDLTDSFCGYYPPITDYKMECTLDLDSGP